MLEARLPAGVPAEELTELFLTAGRLTDPGGPKGITPFFEVPLSHEWPPVVVALVSAGKRLRQSSPIGGLKLRCGGVEASAFPSPTRVASAMSASRAGGIPLKFTAGLHHPARRHDAGIGVMMHGFLNVFVAGVLATARGLDATAVREIVGEEDAASFAFSDDGLRWRYHIASVTEIDFARRLAVTSFGSCSFDEPRDDLRTLGLL